MTDKDSQLDAIERLAIDFNTGETHWVDPKLFLPDGLYYEMRRFLQGLAEENCGGDVPCINRTWAPDECKCYSCRARDFLGQTQPGEVGM